MKREKEKKEERKEKKLQNTQTELLKTVFLFRFMTIEGLMLHYHLKSRQQVRRRVFKLVDLGLVSRHYSSSYRLQGRPAEYYVTIKAISILRNEFEDMGIADLRLIYGHTKASERFIKRSIVLHAIYSRLCNEHAELVTSIQLRSKSFDFLPHPLPDMIAHMDISKDTEHYVFIDYFDDAISIGIHGRKIGDYMKYQEDGGWSGQSLPFPTMLLICETEAMKRRAEKRVRYYDRQHYVLMQFKCITLSELSLNDILEQ